MTGCEASVEPREDHRAFIVLRDTLKLADLAGQNKLFAFRRWALAGKTSSLFSRMEYVIKGYIGAFEIRRRAYLLCAEEM